MESLEAARSHALVERVVVMASLYDEPTVLAWDHSDNLVVAVGPPGTFAQKANAAVPWVHSPWMFLCGDDVKFHDDWASVALDAANGTTMKVVGTNDLGTEAVRSGQHATHMLLNMDYIDEQGASWDGPGTVAHEGYHHWFVDNELVAVAKQRNVWTHATASIVEHLHPYFERGEWDDVYALGESRAREDGELWMQRLAKYAPELLEES